MQRGGFLGRLSQSQSAAGRSLGPRMLERFWILAQEKVATLCRLVADRARFPQPPAAIAEAPAEPPILSAEDRWMRATGAVRTAISGFGRIQSLQAAAACQIDAADYTLQRLLEELSLAMPIKPADGSALRALLATVAEDETVVEETLAA